jgi:hypothetical protein
MWFAYIFANIALRMKNNTLLLSLLLIAFTACKKDANGGTGGNGGGADTSKPAPTILDYKNSNHHLFVGYLVGDGNDPTASFNPANAPDSVDYLEFFAGNDTTRSDWRAAQAKGTKIVVCHFMKDAYFDGSVKDPATKVAGYNPPAGFDSLHANASSTYEHWAHDMYQQIIVYKQLDGIDLDIESGTFGGDVPRNSANGVSLLTAVAKYFGPNCTACTVSKKPTFFFDTDGSSGFESAIYTPYKSNYSYVLFQSYTTGSHYWKGTGTANFPALVTTYGADKLIYLVNGDSFTYPNGTEDVAGGDAKASADLQSYAAWIKANGGVGVGAYRMSRDYNHNPRFKESRLAIQTMNPATK